MKKITNNVISIFNESLKQCSPEKLILNKLKVFKNKIYLNGNEIFKINNKENLYFIALGKAAQSLSSGILKTKNLNIDDYFIIKHFDAKYKVIHTKKTVISTHPLVTKKSYFAAKKLLLFIKKIPINSNVVFLISGGGSAMLAHPIKGLDFSNKSKFINKLIQIGIGEREVNYFRKILSSIKSSKLLSFFNNAKILNLILSDERDNKIDAISSGLTIPQKRKRISNDLFGKVIKQKFCNKKISEVLKNNNKSFKMNNYGNKVSSNIIGDRHDLVKKLKDKFKERFNVKNIIYKGHIFESNFIKAVDKIYEPCKKFYSKQNKGFNILIFTGEIPIRAFIKSKGGRNQHLSAYFIKKFEKFDNFTFCCFSTDGCDFIKGIHGAFIDDEIIKKIKRKKINYDKYLKETNTYYLHKLTNSLIKGKYTDNNFSDFYLFAYQR